MLQRLTVVGVLSLLVVGNIAQEKCLCIDKPNCTDGSHPILSGNCGGHGQYDYYCCSKTPQPSASSSCGPDSPSKVPNCDKEDLGSCGNACCTVQFVRKSTPHDVYGQIKRYLEAASGVFASYKYVTGPDAAGHNPTDDLRQYNLTYKFVFQASHTTTGGYVDTLNFNIQSTDQGTLVTAFSISNIHGALGDNGQNYKSLYYLFTTSPALNVDGSAIKIVHGCGQK